ncbi:MAG: HupE/UreJ family protein [Pleurocapsa sp.]
MKSLKQNSYLSKLSIAAGIVGIELLITAPAFAHHPLGGKMPANFFEGIMSGFGHPMIGLDHLAFIVASGLMAVGMTAGIIIPIAFVIATGIGAGIHLALIDLPIPEIVIAATVVLFGYLLVIKGKKREKNNYYLLITTLAGLSGIFHGFAYGEGIFGAEPTPLVAYLIGFTIIQLAISLVTYILATKLSKRISLKYITRFVGSAIAAIGIVFLSSAIIG